MSPRFLTAEKGNFNKAVARFKTTLQWREAHGVNGVLKRPHRQFFAIKSAYPHSYHLRSKRGCPVSYEKPGQVDWTALRNEGISIEDLVNHSVFCLEYLWSQIEPDDSAKLVTVIDLAGMRNMTTMLDLIQRLMDVTSTHYPERCANIFIINVGFTFNMMFSAVRPLLDPVTREKIHTLRGGEIKDTLLRYIDADALPEEYGGTCSTPLGESPEEKAMGAFVHKLNSNPTAAAAAPTATPTTSNGSSTEASSTTSKGTGGGDVHVATFPPPVSEQASEP